MKMDYRNTKDQFDLIPAGWYSVEVKDVQLGATKKQNYETWNLTLNIVTNNEYYDRKIWDDIIFMEKLESRNKGIFKVFGYNVDSEIIDVEPNDLLNKRCKVAIIINQYTDDNGNIKKNNKIEFFGGYKKIDDKEVPQAPSETPGVSVDDIPF